MTTVGDLLTRLSDKSRSETEEAARNVGIDPTLPVVAAGANGSSFAVNKVGIDTVAPMTSDGEAEPLKAAVVTI